MRRRKAPRSSPRAVAHERRSDNGRRGPARQRCRSAVSWICLSRSVSGSCALGALKPVQEVHRPVRVRAHVRGAHVQQVDGTGGGVGRAAPESGRRSHKSRVRDGSRSSRWSAVRVPLKPAPTIAIGRWEPVIGKAAPLGPDTSFRAHHLFGEDRRADTARVSASARGTLCGLQNEGSPHWFRGCQKKQFSLCMPSSSIVSEL